MNIIDKILQNGFKENHGWNPYNTKNGWYGVTIQHPYAEFVKGTKMLTVDLSEYPNGKKKIIRLRIKGAVIYENEMGLMPSDEIIEKFIND